jgi:simple sugar transport system ATP-binding protein
VGDEDLTGHPYRDFIDAGVHFLPAGRLEEGLVAGLSISEHVVLAGGSKRFIVDWNAAREKAARRIERCSIKGEPTSTADSLSGGNQQRLLLALAPQYVRLLLLEHPTRGLDVIRGVGVVELLGRRAAGPRSCSRRPTSTSSFDTAIGSSCSSPAGSSRRSTRGRHPVRSSGI